MTARNAVRARRFRSLPAHFAETLSALEGCSTTTTGWIGVMAAREIDRVWDIIEKVGVAMLTTQFPAGLRARPVEARPDRDAGIIWFLTDLRSGKDEEVAAAPSKSRRQSSPAPSPIWGKTARSPCRCASASRGYQRTLD
jgi:hypothetical protein